MLTGESSRTLFYLGLILVFFGDGWAEMIGHGDSDIPVNERQRLDESNHWYILTGLFLGDTDVGLIRHISLCFCFKQKGISVMRQVGTRVITIKFQLSLR